MANNNEKFRPTSSFIFKQTGDPLEKVHGVIEGFTKNLSIREVNVQGNQTKVADLEISCALTNKRIEYAFGKEFINPGDDHGSVRVRITFWNNAAENLGKYPPQVNQKVMCAFVNPRVYESKGKDGKIYRTIECTGLDFPKTTSAAKEGGQSSLDALRAASANTTGAAPAAAELTDSNPKPEAAPIGTPAPSGFFDIAFDMDDSELPF